MSGIFALLRSRQLSHAAVLALVSFGFAGCSADTSRFAENPFASSGGPRPPEVTGSVQQPYYNSAPTPRVESRPLPSYQQSSLPPPTMPAQNYNYAQPQSQPTSGGGRGLASYTPPERPIETTSTVAPRSVAAVNNYSREGGTPVIVGTSDTLDGLARRYNVPPSAIMQANGMSGPRMLQPGQRLVIPRRAAVASAPAMTPPPPAMASAPPTRPAAPAIAAAPAMGGANVHIVNRGDTLASIARRNKIGTDRLARANGVDPSSPLKLGSKIMIPSAQVATATPAAPQIAAPVVSKPQQVASAQPAPATVPVTSVGQPKVRMATETTEVEKEAKTDVATSALPTFRWPVRGRVITAYGSKANGKNNDGINVAVPEGTAVKAAEDGVVTYAGNELKGYGNLVLVRHSNGYVTAYAHASELMVKRGDTIKRGQTIMKSGQTGEVASPQLHFEIRKGSTPVDPNQFLNGT